MFPYKYGMVRREFLQYAVYASLKVNSLMVLVFVRSKPGQGQAQLPELSFE